jgi:hypothetical protein
VEAAGYGLLPPGIILLGLQILLLFDLLFPYLIPVPDMEEAGNGLLPPGIILFGLQFLLLLDLLSPEILSSSSCCFLDLLAIYFIPVPAMEEAGNDLHPPRIILWGISANFGLDAPWDYTILRRRSPFFLVAVASEESPKSTGLGFESWT